MMFHMITGVKQLLFMSVIRKLLFSTKRSSDQPWPRVDEKALVKSSITIVVQVNGKVRSKLDVANGISKEEMEALAQADTNVQKFTEGKTIRKVIVVPNKLVNIVAN